MLYITVTNIDQKTARAKHVSSLIRFSKYLKKDIKFLCKTKTNKNKILFYLKVIFHIIKYPKRKVYTRDLDIALIIFLLRRRGAFEVHQYGFLRKELNPKILSIRRMIFSTIINSSNISIVVLTKGSSKFLRRLYKSRIKKTIFIIKDASDNSKKDFDNTYNPKRKKINIGYCGSFLPGKGGNESIRIAKYAPQFNFLLAGPLNPKDELELKKYKNCLYFGNLNEESLIEFYERCDILIAPLGKRIFLDKEKKNEITFFTSPLKIFEYLAKNKPIIITDCPALREFKDFEGVWIINKEDTLSISKWIDTVNEISQNILFRNEKLLSRLRDQNIYTWGDRLNDMEDIL